MNQSEPARPQVHASIDELRKTREILEDAGVPSDDVATSSQAPDLDLPDTSIRQTSVQPSAGMHDELAGTAENGATPPDEHNQRDSSADVLLG